MTTTSDYKMNLQTPSTNIVSPLSHNNLFKTFSRDFCRDFRVDIYSNIYHDNNNVDMRKSKKRCGWKNNSKKMQHDGDKSAAVQCLVVNGLENNGIKQKVSRNYGLPHEHYSGFCNNNYRCNESITEVITIAHHPNTNGFYKNKFYLNNGKKHKRDRNNYSQDITRRVHGLMERFKFKAQLFQINPVFPSFGEISQIDQSIWNLFCTTRQTRTTYFNKLELWEKLYLHISRVFERCGLFMVGSTVSGLGTENSDVDICLLLRSYSLDPRTDALHYLDIIQNSFANCDFVKSSEIIFAKVPILKFRSCLHGFEVDLNCNNAVGIRNTHLLHCYAQLDWRVRPLVVVVKLWAQSNGINDAKNMTISSYSLALMVINFLQCGVNPPVLPCLHELYPDKFIPEKEIQYIDIQEDLPKFLSSNKQTLSDLLQGFLYYYAYFSYETYAISVRLASRVLIDECRYARSKKNDPHQWKYLCIEEPFDLTNTARSVYDLPTFKRIQWVFQVSNETLRQTRNLNCIFNHIKESQS